MLTKPIRKARAPSIEAVSSLERAACESPLIVVQYASGVFRYLIGASGRFDDGQHLEERLLEKVAGCIEGRAWQTKTVGQQQNAAKVLPLSCPLTSFSGLPWWEPFLSTHKKLGEGPLANRDFLLQVAEPSLAAFSPGPISRSQALSLLRRCYREGGLDRQEAKLLSLAGLRVFAPNQAFALGISQEKRRARGRWAESQTAEVYVRDHRKVVEEIWHHIAKANRADQKVVAPLEVPISLSSSYYVPQPAGVEPADPEADSEPKKKQSFLNREHLEFGPLRLGALAGSPSERVKGHLFDTRDRGFGCSWKPTPERVHFARNKEAWDTLAPRVGSYCKRCFLYFGLPDGWLPAFGSESLPSTSDPVTSLVTEDKDLEDLPPLEADDAVAQVESESSDSDSDGTASSASGAASDSD